MVLPRRLESVFAVNFVFIPVSFCKSNKSFPNGQLNLLYTSGRILIYGWIQTCCLPEYHLEHGLIHVTLQQVDAAVMLAHDLAGEGEADAGAFFLSGVERHKDLLLGSNRAFADDPVRNSFTCPLGQAFCTFP